MLIERARGLNPLHTFPAALSHQLSASFFDSLGRRSVARQAPCRYINGFSLVGADAHIGPLGCVSVVPRRPYRQKPLLEERWHAKRDGEVCRRAAAAARKRPPAFVACHDGASDAVPAPVYPNSAISWATRSSLSAMAARVLPSSSSSSQPRRSAPWRITSREQPAANFLSLNFFLRL